MENAITGTARYEQYVYLDTSSSSISSAELDSTDECSDPQSQNASQLSESSEDFHAEHKAILSDSDSSLSEEELPSLKGTVFRPVEFGRVERPLPTAESESRPSTSLAGSNGSGLYVPLLSTKYLSSEKENVASWKPTSSTGSFQSHPVKPRQAVLISPQRKPPKKEETFKLAGTYKTLQRQLDVYDEMIRNMSARLPDGGAQLKTQRRQIIARMNSIKNPTSLSGPISEEKAQKCKQAMMNKQMSVLTSGAVEQLYKTMESCPGADSTASDPPGLKVSLFPHQKQGLAWAQWRERQRPAGGILADEMGLGKTLTMLSLVVSSLNTDRTRSQPPAKGSVAAGLVRSSGTLIVCPKSLMLQWDSEITKRFENGLLRSHVHHGSSRTADPKRLAHFDVVFTTYNLVASEFQSCSTDTSKESGGLKKRKAQFHPLFQVHWKRVILDEAHMIRNPDTAMSQGAAALTSDYRWCVTGTPIQNKELDLYALIRFLNLAPFNDRNIWREQVQKGSKGIQRMTALVKGLILRRMKTELGLDGKQLVELPPKDISLHQLALSSEEQAIHDAIFLHTKTTLETWLNKKQGESTTEQEKPKEVSELVKRMSEVVFDLGVISSEDPGLSSGYSFILALLLRIRQSCVHPNLLVSKKKPAMGDKINEEDTDFLSSHFQGLTLGPVPGGEEEEDSQKSPSKESKDLLQQFNIQFHSTRVNALMKELQKVRETAPNDKCVIFSQWTSMIDIIEYHLGQHGIGFERIDGQVSPQERQRLVDTFNSTAKFPEVLTVSLLAGGVGLNLIGGNHVFIMDLHWNPFNELQACDRVHRVGQTKPVYVHRFFCGNSVEERILQLQTDKKEMAGNVLSGAGVRSSNKLSLEDLKQLFQVE